jgi:hypothetical protein
MLATSKNFKYLGCEISYEDGQDIQQKLAKLAQITGIVNNTFKLILVQKFSRMKVYNVLALPLFLYGSKIFNSLPLCLTILKKENAKFKTAFRKYLNTHSLYSIQEFFTSKIKHNVW